MKSTDVITPTAIKFPVAKDGTRNTIPLNATGSNLASIEEGFPDITMQSIEDGGLPPYGEDFNGLFYLATDYKAYLQDGGYITFDETVSNLIGGYPQGAILDYYDENTNSYTKVISLIDDNTYNFNTTPAYIDNTYWRDVNFGGANLSLSNINSTAKAYINNSKALLTGAVGNNADIYADILKYAHSTYNGTALTLSGTPIIADDGIPLFFNKSNTISLPQLTIGSNFDLFGRITMPSALATATEGLITSSGYNHGGMQFAVNNSSGDIVISLRSSSAEGSDFDICKNVKVATFQFSKTYDYCISWTGAKYVFYYKLDDDASWTSFDIITSSTKISTAAGYELQLGGTGNSYWGGDRPFTGTIDLKYTAFYSDGKLVFNCNQTSLDTIKSANYTETGSPVISTDGVLSTTSSSDYVTTSSITLGDNWDIIVPLRSETLKTSAVDTMFRSAGNYQHLSLGVGTSATRMNIWIQDKDGTAITVAYPNLSQVANILYLMKLSCRYDGTNYTITASASIDNGVTWTDGTPTVTTAIPYVAENAESWQIQPYRISADSTCDLNGVQIYKDGNLVYQPCLLIPYNISKMGSKVVDTYARYRVDVLYNQNGYAPYYTIDQLGLNYTLPQGEIYGMFINQSTPHIVEEYINGTSGYTLYSNGKCEQWGVQIVTNGYGTVSLIKPYKDTNYVPTACENHGTNVASSFNEADIVAIDSVAVDSFRILGSTDGDAAITAGVSWHTIGYIS